jgi:hypothetical protein
MLVTREYLLGELCNPKRSQKLIDDGARGHDRDGTFGWATTRNPCNLHCDHGCRSRTIVFDKCASVAKIWSDHSQFNAHFREGRTKPNGPRVMERSDAFN